MGHHSRIAFGFLTALGLFVVLYGFVGPITTGTAFAEVVVEQLGLQKEPETYSKLTMLYADLESRRGLLLSGLGLLIALPAAFGLWTTRP
jgi:hypothetical protein